MGIIAANSEYVIAAKALVTPARRIDTTIAGPAPTWPESPEIAVPMAAKIPAPMTAPIPSAVSWRGPSERLSPPPTSLSAMHWSTVLRLKSCALDKQRRQHERDRAQQLDEHVQRRPGRVLERIADGITDHGGLVRRTPLPTVLTGLDELLGVVPGATAVVEQGRHENPGDRAHHEERRHGLGADMEQHLEDETHSNRHPYGEQPGSHHGLERPDGHDVHRSPVVRPRRALQDPGVGLELAAYFLNHADRRLGHRADGERREPEHQHGAEQPSHEHLGLRDVHGRERRAE